jgi:hypothetical protein
MDGLLVYDMGWHEEDGSAKRHRFQIHEAEEDDMWGNPLA